MKLFKKAKKGFTLVELVVVIAVIAILAAVSVGAYFGVTESAKNSQAQQEGKAVHTNIVLIANDPANSKIATFGKTGVTIENGGDFEDKLEAAVGSVDYLINGVDGADEADTNKTYDATLTFKGTDKLFTKFSYTISSGHVAYFNLVTGEQIDATAFNA